MAVFHLNSLGHSVVHLASPTPKARWVLIVLIYISLKIF